MFGCCDASADEIYRLKRELTRASAELRHAYKAKYMLQPVDWNLIDRAIQILERAVSTTKEPSETHPR